MRTYVLFTSHNRIPFCLILSQFNDTGTTVYLDDVIGINDEWTQEEIESIPDDIIESERSRVEEFFESWDHPKSSAEERWCVEDMHGNNIFEVA